MKKKPLLTAVDIIIIIVIVGFAAFMAKPVDLHRHNPTLEKRSCFSNQAIILDAVERYNIDHNYDMKKLDMEKLISENYLKVKIFNPTKDCEYTSQGDLTDTGYIVCNYHGDKERRFKGQLEE